MLRSLLCVFTTLQDSEGSLCDSHGTIDIVVGYALVPLELGNGDERASADDSANLRRLA